MGVTLAIEIRQKANPKKYANTLGVLGMVSRCRMDAASDPDHAIRELEKHLQILKATPWRRNQLAVMALLAAISWKRGDTDRAIEVLAQCLEVTAALGIKRAVLEDIGSRELLEAPALRQALGPAANTLRAQLVEICVRDQALTHEAPHGAKPDSEPSITAILRSNADLPVFTGREHEMLFLIERGLPVKHIARALAVSPDTAKFHVKNIYQKLGVHDRGAAREIIRKMMLFENIR